MGLFNFIFGIILLMGATLVFAGACYFFGKIILDFLDKMFRR